MKVMTGSWSTAGWRRQLVNRLVHADTPRRTAAAFALGVFLSFSPFLGLQMVLGFGTAMFLRLSRVAVLAGLCTNLPWFMVPWYTITTLAGAAVLQTPVRADISTSLSALLDLPIYRAEFWTRALEILSPFFWAFMVGSTAGALVVGSLAYVSVARMMAAHVVREST